MPQLYVKITNGIHESFLSVRKVIEQLHSPYQSILVAEIEGHGKTLILDNEIQTCYVDYAPYHEALCHFYTPQPHERCMILGAGEGVSIDVLLRRGWKNIDAVEIDHKVTEMVDKHLPTWNNNIFKRQDEFNMIFDDGMEVLKATPDQYYSYVIFDLNSSAILQDKDLWISQIHRVLHHNGLVTCQDGPKMGISYFDETLRKYFGTIPQRKELLDWTFIHAAKKPL